MPKRGINHIFFLSSSFLWKVSRWACRLTQKVPVMDWGELKILIRKSCWAPHSTLCIHSDLSWADHCWQGLSCPIFLDATTVKRNATSDLIFSSLRQKLPIVAMCSLGQRPWDHYMETPGKTGKLLIFVGIWLIVLAWVHFCVCLCHTLWFAWVVLVWLSMPGGSVICTALGLSAFAVFHCCGSFFSHYHFFLWEQ